LSFNLLASKKIPSSYRFVFFGDTWFDWGASKIDAISRYKIFRACLDKAASLKPLFILYGGDGVFSGELDELNYFKDTVVAFMNKTKIPFFMVPGNHERLKGSLANCQKIVGGRLNYNIDFPHTNPRLRVIMLNNTLLQNGQYFFDDSALHFQTSIKTKANVIVTMHVPPRAGNFPKNNKNTFPINVGNNKKFMDILLKNQAKIQLGLVSHIHTSGFTTIGQIPFVLSGDGGAGQFKTPPTQNPSIAAFRVGNGKVTNFQKVQVTNSSKQPNPKFVFLQQNGKIVKVPV
jgi:hypothetical protein